MTRLRTIIIAAVFGAMAALGGTLAYAGVAGGPSEAPGGTYVQQGQVVSFCFTHGKLSGGWIEWNTNVAQSGPGNCPPGDTQVSFPADPMGWPIPSPSPAGTG